MADVNPNCIIPNLPNTPTLAQRMATAMGDDGYTWLHPVSMWWQSSNAVTGRVHRNGAVVWRFRDGSRLIQLAHGWDVGAGGAECTCDCWESTGHSEDCTSAKRES